MRMKLRCGGCRRKDKRYGRVLATFDSQHGFVMEGVSFPAGQRSRPQIEVERAELSDDVEAYHITCHKECGAVYLVRSDELAAAAEHAAAAGLWDVEAGTEVGDRLL